MYNNICTDQKSPDTLFHICLRLVSKDINKIRPDVLRNIPSYIKYRIVKYTTEYLFPRLDLGFKDDETINALLDAGFFHLKLTNSITTNSTLKNISEKCPKLHELILDGSRSHFTESAFQRFIPKMKFLTLLSLKGLTEITDQSLYGLSSLEHLQHLNLKKCTSLTDDCGKILRDLKLKGLNLSYTLIGKDWLTLIKDSILSSNIVDLNLSFCKNLGDSDLQNVNWPKLQYIGLLGLNDLAFIENLGKLQYAQWSIPF